MVGLALPPRNQQFRIAEVAKLIRQLESAIIVSLSVIPLCLARVSSAMGGAPLFLGS